ncbi:MAG: MBL fold metallo-hydrolase [Prevotella sp.]
MKVTLLGTGTSGGVPALGCSCGVCSSKDPRDKRLRCVALVETDTTRVLIDCGPDIRQQLLPLPFAPIDGVLLTHSHYDHVGGIDDLRPFCHFGHVNIYANPVTCDAVRRLMPYCFEEHLYPNVPLLRLNEIFPHRPFRIGDIDILPVEVMHDSLPILGFRMGDFAYITDMKTIPDSEMGYLRGVKYLVVNALRFEKAHHSHQLVDDAIRFARVSGAQSTYIIHVSHHIGRHADAELRLPSDVHLAYDGMVIDVSCD